MSRLDSLLTLVFSFFFSQDGPQAGVPGGRGGPGGGRLLGRPPLWQARVPRLRQPGDTQVQLEVFGEGSGHVGARGHALHNARGEVSSYAGFLEKKSFSSSDLL